MSVAINFKEITKAVSEQLETCLTVKSVVDPLNKFQQQMYVHAFDIVQNQVYLPFSFFYHHQESKGLKKLPSVSHLQQKYKFEGSLLPRQLDIKEETLEILSRTGSVVLCLHTGFGKTIFAIYLLSRLGLKTLILCHRSIIIQQWVDSVKRHLPAVRVGVMNLAEYKKNSECWKDLDVLVCNVINIPKCPREVYAPFGCVVVDEVHTICTTQFSKSLPLLTPSYLIGLSATPFRSDGMDQLLELYFGPEIIYKPMQRFFNAYKLSTGFVPTVTLTADGKMNWNSVLESQATSRVRNELICRLVTYFEKRNILILVKRKDHALGLKQMLLEKKEDADCFIHTAKSANYECRILIATYSKGGVGFDHPRLDMLITGADVEENFMQYLGRVFRRDDVLPIYIDLRDSMSTLVKHSQSRLKICKEIGGEVKEFDKTFLNKNTCFYFFYELSFYPSTLEK